MQRLVQQAGYGWLTLTAVFSPWNRARQALR
jgi:hypothetical protein